VTYFSWNVRGVPKSGHMMVAMRAVVGEDDADELPKAK